MLLYLFSRSKFKTLLIQMIVHTVRVEAVGVSIRAARPDSSRVLPRRYITRRSERQLNTCPRPVTRWSPSLGHAATGSKLWFCQHHDAHANPHFALDLSNSDKPLADKWIFQVSD